MKRLTTLITLVLFTALLLPSCGVSIQKRQHNKGYYVSTNHRIPAAKDNKREIRPEQEQQAVATAELPEEPTQARAESQEVLAEAVVTQPTAEQPTSEAPAARNTDASTPAKPATLQHTERTSFVQKVEKMAERNPLAKKLNTQKMKSSARSSSSEGLSLFWIVILVLLVLWALGVIGGGWGLGGLIYVLLVIALILLILWLLRIV